MVEVAAARDRRSEDIELMRGLWKTFVKKREGGSLKVRYHAGQWLSDRHCGAHWPAQASQPAGHCPCVEHFTLVATATIARLRRKQAEQPWWMPQSMVAYACGMIERVEADLYRERRVQRGAIARTDDQFTRGKALFGGLDGRMEKSILLVYAVLAGRLEYFAGWRVVDATALSEVARDLGEPEGVVGPRFPEKRAIVREHANTVSPRNRLSCSHGSVLPWWEGRVVHPLEEHALRPRGFAGAGRDVSLDDIDTVALDERTAVAYGEPLPAFSPADEAKTEQIRTLIAEVGARLADPGDASREEIREALTECAAEGVIPEWMADTVAADEALMDDLVDGVGAIRPRKREE